MKNILKYISVFAYVVAVSYYANKFVEQKFVAKNYLYVITQFIIMAIGAFLIDTFFNNINKKIIEKSSDIHLLEL